MFSIQPWYWLVLGVILMIFEMFVPTFAMLWFGLAAVVVALISWLLPLSEVLQVLLWLALSILMGVGWIKYIKPLSKSRTTAGLGGSVIVGEVGMIVVKPLPDRIGTVRFSVPIVGATEWMCRTVNQDVDVGQRVIVTGVAGNELIVAPLNTTIAPIE